MALFALFLALPTITALAPDSVDLLAVTCNFVNENSMVTVNSATGKFTPVIANFSTWDVPDAAFDESTDTLYMVTRVKSDSDNLKLVAYGRNGAVKSSHLLDLGMKPDNLGAPHFDAAAQKLYMTYGPFNKTTKVWGNMIVQIGLDGKVLRTAQPKIAMTMQQCLASDAYSPTTGTMYQLYINTLHEVQTLAATNMLANPPTTKFIKTEISNDDFLIDVIYHEGSIFGFDKAGYLNVLNPTTGAYKKLSKERLLHNVGPWYPTIHNTTGGATLFVCNTTNGGPTISAKDMRGEYAKQSRQSGGGTISISADDDSPAHTHSALSAFDLATGDLLSSVVVAAPLTWMGALSTKAR